MVMEMTEDLGLGLVEGKMMILNVGLVMGLRDAASINFYFITRSMGGSEGAPVSL